jgi:SHS2 domain-containing protein
MAYEIIDDMTRADVAFRVRGNDLAELFIAGGRALASIMLQNLEEIRPTISINFDCQAADLELLYYDYLQEFIFYKDSQRLLLLPEKIEFNEHTDSRLLTCQARGEKIDRTRHLFSVDIKAVTMHGLKVVKEKNAWTAMAVVDV